jgi:hypothetical protein
VAGGEGPSVGFDFPSTVIAFVLGGIRGRRETEKAKQEAHRKARKLVDSLRPDQWQGYQDEFQKVLAEKTTGLRQNDPILDFLTFALRLLDNRISGRVKPKNIPAPEQPDPFGENTPEGEAALAAEQEAELRKLGLEIPIFGVFGRSAQSALKKIDFRRLAQVAQKARTLAKYRKFKDPGQIVRRALKLGRGAGTIGAVIFGTGVIADVIEKGAIGVIKAGGPKLTQEQQERLKRLGGMRGLGQIIRTQEAARGPRTRPAGNRLQTLPEPVRSATANRAVGQPTRLQPPKGQVQPGIAPGAPRPAAQPAQARRAPRANQAPRAARRPVPVPRTTPQEILKKAFDFVQKVSQATQVYSAIRGPVEAPQSQFQLGRLELPGQNSGLASLVETRAMLAPRTQQRAARCRPCQSGKTRKRRKQRKRGKRQKKICINVR